MWWPFASRPKRPDALISAEHIEAAADYLVKCSAHHGRAGMLFEHFVEGDAWYDQSALAVQFGLNPRHREHMSAVYSFLGLIFVLAADHAHREGLGRVESRDGRTFFVLNEKPVR